MWRLKVINGCSSNDDILLPLVPQTSLLQPFYSHWRDEDEDRHKTVERIEAERIAEEGCKGGQRVNRKQGKQRPGTSRRRYRIAVKDWLKKIPHVAFGRHTQLPDACRLRHVCVSRLHCRVVYVGDAAIHRVILSIYPPYRQRLVNGTHEKKMGSNRTNNNNNNNNNGDSYIINIDSGSSSSSSSSGNSNSGMCMNNSEKDENEGEKDHDDPSVFYGPHYRLLNFGANPVYINDTPLPWGESRCLRENDVVAFLENPFDEEGGVLQPLHPEDLVQRNDKDSAKKVTATRSGAPKDELTLTSSTVRVLFNSVGNDNDGPTGDVEAPAAAQTYQPPDEEAEEIKGREEVVPVFVEVNGKRIARYRPLHVPQNLLQRQRTQTRRTATPATGTGTGSTPLGQDASLLVGDMIIKEGSSTLHGVGAAVYSEAFTPSPRRPAYYSPLRPQEQNNNNNSNSSNRNAKKEEDGEEKWLYNDHNGYMDVVGDVVSPLQQRVVPSLRRSVGTPATPNGDTRNNNNNNNSTSNTAVCGEPPFNVVSARLPVYVFARRSPSPVGFTRQAPTIGRLNLRKAEEEEPRGEGDEEHESRGIDRSGGMTEWVREGGKEVKTTSTVRTTAPAGRRKRRRPQSGKRR